MHTKLSSPSAENENEFKFDKITSHAEFDNLEISLQNPEYRNNLVNKIIKIQIYCNTNYIY